MAVSFAGMHVRLCSFNALIACMSDCRVPCATGTRNPETTVHISTPKGCHSECLYCTLYPHSILLPGVYSGPLFSAAQVWLINPGMVQHPPTLERQRASNMVKQHSKKSTHSCDRRTQYLGTCSRRHKKCTPSNGVQ